MIIDNATIFATTEPLPNGAVAGGSGAPISVFCGNVTGAAAATPITIDLAQSGNPLGIGYDEIGSSHFELGVQVTTSFTTTSLLATVEFQLVSSPINPALLTSATTSGKLLSLASVVTNSTNDTFTINNHGLALGTPFYLSALATTTGLTTNTVLYYAVPTDANNFKAATSLANAQAGTVVDMLTGNGTATVVFMPVIHATTGAIPTVFLKAGARFIGTTMRQTHSSFGKFTASYANGPVLPLGAMTIPSTLTGGGIGSPANAISMRAPGRYLALVTVLAGANSDTTGRFSVQAAKNQANGLAFYPTGLDVR